MEQDVMQTDSVSMAVYNNGGKQTNGYSKLRGFIVLHSIGPVLSIALHILLIAVLGGIVVCNKPDDVGDGPVIDMVTLKPVVLPPPPLEEPEFDDVVTDDQDVDIVKPDIDMGDNIDDVVGEIAINDSVAIIDVSSIGVLGGSESLKLTGLTTRTEAISTKSMGYSDGMEGDLLGVLYDLKRDSKGRDRKWDFIKDVGGMVRNNFRHSSVKNFKQIPRPLYLSHLFIPKMSAEFGPKQFGVEKEMKPKGFAIRYTGEIDPPKSGRFRFAGHGDDLLTVLIDGKVVLEANWGFSLSGWKPKDYVGKHKCFTGQNVVYGDWIKFEQGKKHKIDLLFGEKPGGAIAAVLMVQEKNKEYKLTNSGRPILPIFALQNLSPAELKRLHDYKEWEFAKDIPNFGEKAEYVADTAGLGIEF